MIKRKDVIEQMSTFCKIQTDYYSRKSSYPGGWPTYRYWIDNMSYELTMLVQEEGYTKPEKIGIVHTLTLSYEKGFSKSGYISFDYERSRPYNSFEGDHYIGHSRGISGIESFERKRFEINEIIPTLFKFMEPDLSDKMIRNYRINGILS